jgi:hypothetical protein
MRAATRRALFPGTCTELRNVSAPTYSDTADATGGACAARVGFLFIGGAHHMLHLAPVAVELARDPAISVQLFAGDAEDASALDRVLARLGARMPITILPTPGWAKILPSLKPSWAALKLPRILAGRRMLKDLDVLVTAERTSTILKRLPGRGPALVHIPHGAGDRAQGFEPRIALFDHVIVAGPKDRDRMIDAGLVAPERCSISGYIKLSAILATQRGTRPTRLFDNDRPTILYNPHFARNLSSWQMFGERLVWDIAATGEFNLIVAPHVRLQERLSTAERNAMLQLGEWEGVIVDLGSERSSDMTYTLAADIYVGDVSSQVFEFVHRPRPCVFLNATGSEHGNDPDFAFWRFGEVVSDPADVLPAISRARSRHPIYAPVQKAAVDRALGPCGENAAANAAAVITTLLEKQRGTEQASAA